ncbi:MAG: hypothetical protein VB082_09275 [Christensenella sp.]|nr:hypothetical protein [Christensenella sp.]
MQVNEEIQAAYENGEKIILTNENEVRAYIQDAIDGKNLNTVAYAKVGERLSDDIKEISGGVIDMENAYMELVAYDLKHAFAEHSTAKEQGDINLNREDFLNIVNYIENYDDVLYATRYKSGNIRVGLRKILPNGNALIIESVSNSRNALQFKNMIGISDEKMKTEYGAETKRSAVNSRGSESSNISLRDTDTSEKNHSPAEGAKASPITSETNSGTDSFIDIISSKDADVNNKFSISKEIPAPTDADAPPVKGRKNKRRIGD